MIEKIVLRHAGSPGVKKIEEYTASGGFKALLKARDMGPENVIAEVKKSRLRGRGGAGFPTGVKWEIARNTKSDERYVICNADEGEVGTFKDRFIIERDPFSLIEGIAIAAYAIGAKKAYIYLRKEYHFLLDTIKTAIDDSSKRNFIDIPIIVQEGAGAYVCGEESALMNSTEGKRGEARFRPPFPPTTGLFGKPTIINNVETLMNIPPIIEKGGEWFSSIGTDQSTGTKVFSVSGDVGRPGVYELVMGSKLSELLSLAGAGDIKMVQIGGATGNVIPGSMVDVPLSYETVLGAGAVMAFNRGRKVIDFVYKTMEFLREESCGKCTPCRVGTDVMAEIFERLVNGEGAPEDIAKIEALSRAMKYSSLCGLGQTAPVPIEDTIKYFRDEYEIRIKQSIFLKTFK